MTCIVGVIRDGEVWMGGDSYGECQGIVVPVADPKIFRRKVSCGDSMLIGVAGDSRVGALMKYVLKIPDFANGGHIEAYLICDFSNAVRECLRNAGCLKIENNVESCNATVLIGFCGQLWTMTSDFNVWRCSREIRAIGSGEDVAHGALMATRTQENFAPGWIETALYITSEIISTVCAPFHVEKL